MHSSVGILKITGTEKYDSLFNDMSGEYGHKWNCLEIELENQLQKIEALIIVASEMSDYVEVCQWLVLLRMNKPLFVWIVSKKDDSNLCKLYSELAMNSIVNVVDSEISNKRLLFEVKKAVDFKTNIIRQEKYQLNENNIFLDEHSLKLISGDSEIELTRQEFKIMSVLHNQINNVVPYQELMHAIWTDVDNGNYQYRLANLVFHIRKKLKKQSHVDIKIVRTKGYKLGLK